MNACRWILLVVCVAILASPATAAPKKKGKGSGGRSSPPSPVLQNMFGDAYRNAKLSTVQAQRLYALAGAYSPRINAVRQKEIAVYTKEQRDLIERARAMAVRAGVNPKNIPKRVQEAVSSLEFSAEQKETLAKIKAEKSAIKSSMKQDASKFLTPAQLKTLFPSGGKPKKAR